MELVGSFVYKVNGKTYILTGDHGVYAHEVIEPKLTPIDGGTIELTPAMAEAAATGILMDRSRASRFISRARFLILTTVCKNVRTITIDGKLTRLNGMACQKWISTLMERKSV